VTNGEHEPIVALELWEQVQKQLSGRSCPPTKQITRHFLLSGLLKCPTCGSSMVPTHVTRHRKNGTSRINHYYVCNRYNSGGRSLCQPNLVRADVAESWVSDRIRHFLSHPTVAERLVDEIKARRDKRMMPVQQAMKRIDAQIDAQKKRSLRCYELFEDGHIDGPELRKRLDEIRAETSLLEEERAQLERTVHAHPERTIPAAGIRQALDNFRTLLQNASPEHQKKLFWSLIDKIIVPEDRDITKAVIQGTSALLSLEIPPIQTKGEKQA